MTTGRVYAELSAEDIENLEWYYCHDTRSIREICKELDINYDSYIYIKDRHFPEAERCQKRQGHPRIIESLKNKGITRKTCITLKCKYIKTTIPVSALIEEFGLTVAEFRYIKQQYFPDWNRQGSGRAQKMTRKDADDLTYCTDDEVEEALNSEEKSCSVDSDTRRWLEKNWRWAAADRVNKPDNRRTKVICSSGRRFG